MHVYVLSFIFTEYWIQTITMSHFELYTLESLTEKIFHP